MGITINHSKAKLIIVLFYTLSMCMVQFATAQSNNNHFHLQEKYWNYRERFKKLFVEIGSEQNQGIPITTRFNYQYAASREPGYVAPSCAANDYGTLIGGGDNPLREIGTYMAILSTEIGLLKMHQQPYKSTMQELYFLLMAVNRLDRFSDKYHILNDPANSLDGRFMRSDQNASASDNWFRYDTTKYVGFKSYGTFTKLTNWLGPPNCDSMPYEYKNIMSKDEIIGLLWGLAFVKKYVPNEFVDDTRGVDGIYIVNEAMAIANRIMGYLTGQQTYDQKCGLFQNNVNITENWTIIYPLITSKIDDGTSNQFKRDDLIGNDYFAEIAPGIVELAAYITGNNYSPIKTKSRTNGPRYAALCQNYNRSFDGSNRYQIITSTLTFDRSNPVHYIIMSSTILGSIFLNAPDNAWDSANLNLEAGMLGPLSSTNAFNIMTAYKNEIRYALAYTQFRNLTPTKPASYWANILNDAPACSHISVDSFFNKYNNLYFGRRLFGSQDFGLIGIRNGSDFMLLYNLFHLQYLSNQEPYFKMACDCEPRSTLFNGMVHTITGNETRGETKINAIQNYQQWDIPIESYISKPITVATTGHLRLVEFVTLCTRMDSTLPNNSQINGILEVGDNTLKGCLRIGNRSTVMLPNL